jgi:hypothetical protein
MLIHREIAPQAMANSARGLAKRRSIPIALVARERDVGSASGEARPEAAAAR